MSIKWPTTLIVVALAAAVAGCGGSGGSSAASSASSAVSSVAGAHVIEIDVSPSGFSYVKSSVTAKAGPVVIHSMNPQSVGHDISLNGNGVNLHGKIVSNGGVSVIAIQDLKPGTYTYYCSVPGHEAAGMKGTLTVS
jgi:plastocyanin